MSITAAVTSGALLTALLSPPSATGPVEPGTATSACMSSFCLHVERTDTDYTTWAEFTRDVTLGYFLLTGPNLDVRTPVKPWRAGEDTQHYTRRGQGKVCAEAWTHHSGQWHLSGSGCIVI